MTSHCNAKRCWTYQTYRNPDATVATSRDQWRHKMTRVVGNYNCADLGTKHLDYQAMNRHLKFCGMRVAEGWSRITPQLELYSTVDSDEH